MIPGLSSFQWTTGHMIFLGIFYVVVLVVAVTLLRSLLRTRRDFRAQSAGAIQWKADFHDLPARDRRCRHEGIVCENGFDCGRCVIHQEHATTEAAAPAASALGFDVPLDRLYHRGHTWVRQESDGTLTVGLDELGSRLAGKPDKLELPPVGAQLRTNTPACRLQRGASKVRVLAPVDGTVVATGGASDDWLLKLQPAGSGTAHLLQGGEVLRWMSNEMDRLQLILPSAGLGPALADGGTLVPDLAAAMPKNDWSSVAGEMFLEP